MVSGLGFTLQSSGPLKASPTRKRRLARLRSFTPGELNIVVGRQDRGWIQRSGNSRWQRRKVGWMPADKQDIEQHADSGCWVQ